MRGIGMNHLELVTFLEHNNFTEGWALLGLSLVLWEHDADPPAPLTRPEANNDLAG